MPSKGNPNLIIRMQPHEKAELARLARVLGYDDVSSYLRPLIQRAITQGQQEERRRMRAQGASHLPAEGDATPTPPPTPSTRAAGGGAESPHIASE